MGTTYVDIKESHEKIQNNLKFIRAIKRGYPSKDAHRANVNAIVLDGSRMQTSRNIIDMIPNLRTLIVPERSSEKRCIGDARVVHAQGRTLWNVLNKMLPTRAFNAAFFDYMGTVTGCRSTRDFPLEDIQMFLNNQATRSGPVVLALTFAARMRVGNDARSDGVQSDIYSFYLCPLFKAACFRIERYESRIYSRTGHQRMVSIVAVLTFDVTLKRGKKNVEFVVTQDKRYFEGYNLKL